MKCRGFSLSETLIALFLSSFILTLLLQQYLAIKKQYKTMQMKFEEGLDTQLVAGMIRRSIKSAGFSPCLRLDYLNPELKIIDLEPQSLTTHHMNENFEEMNEIINPNLVLTSNHCALHAGQEVVIADCYHAETQKIEKVVAEGNQQQIMLAPGLRYAYAMPTYIGESMRERFFVQDNMRHHKALFYQFHSSEELTPAINDLSVAIETDSCEVKIALTTHSQGIINFKEHLQAC